MVNVSISKRAIDFAEWNVPPITMSEIQTCFLDGQNLLACKAKKKISYFTGRTTAGRKLQIAFTVDNDELVVIYAREAPQELDMPKDLAEWENAFAV